MAREAKVRIEAKQSVGSHKESKGGGNLGGDSAENRKVELNHDKGEEGDLLFEVGACRELEDAQFHAGVAEFRHEVLICHLVEPCLSLCEE